MGNQGGKSEIKPQMSQSHYAISSNQNIQEKGVYHKNANAMKPGAVIFLPQSAVGAQLKTTQIQDYNNYIKVKAPAQTMNERFTRGMDYNNQQVKGFVMETALLGFQNQYRATVKRTFGLKIDDENGVAQQTQIFGFDYDKKLLHFIKKAEKAGESSQIKV